MDTIEAGRDAWQRLQAHQRTAWTDWVTVGRALQAGRAAALVAAKVKTPFGAVYTRMFGTWLRENGLDGVGQQVRHRLLKCMEHLDAIERWRATLTEVRRSKYNHPDGVWAHWHRDMQAGPPRAYSRPYRPLNTSGGRATHAGYHRAVSFDQDMVKRAGDAMRKAWCNDCYKLAAIALSAAIRHEVDVLNLLPDPPQPKPVPRQIAAPVVLELT
jgi:hypothetical protein